MIFGRRSRSQQWSRFFLQWRTGQGLRKKDPAPIKHGMDAPRALYADAVAVAPPSRAVTLSMSGSPMQYAPLAPADVVNRSLLAIGELALDSALTQHTAPAAWCHTASAADLLTVTVIGVSVTQGCGAGKTRRCLPHLGWTRRLADAFGAVAAQHRAMPQHGVRWNVWPKNAAPLRFWLQCTASSFELSPTTNIVLVETEPTLTSTDHHDLQQLVRALRRGAPNAVIGFVLWPSQRQLTHDRAAERMVRRMAATEGFDVLSASTMLDAATRVGAHSALYGDLVHPSLDGHAMIGALVCAWLVANLMASAKRCPLSEHLHRAAATNIATPLPASLSLSPPPPAVAAAYERCFARADEMPVVTPDATGWRLTDEGISKGVVKLGYVSTRPGDTLQLGPILPEAQCGLFDVSLGYLLSWRREQGALHVSCSGSCACMPMYQYRWQKERDHEPFPELQTWTYARGQSVDTALSNASTTAYARFLLGKFPSATDGPACKIEVTHTRTQPHGSVGAPSRVRVDGLSLKLSSCATNCIAVRHASGTLNRTRLQELRSACAAGAAKGSAGHFAPSCAGCSDQ